eukprot:m.455359 g.455359  ORF g.455359 m.455359 type:complete len:572 (-) comp21571_c0_seq1:512-2227(-)
MSSDTSRKRETTATSENEDSTFVQLQNAVVVSGEASEASDEDDDVDNVESNTTLLNVSPVPEREIAAGSRLHKKAGVPVWTVTLVRPRKDGLTLPALGIRLSHNHPRGVKIAAVIENSPASENSSSITAGDVVVEVNGKYVLDTSYFDLTTAIATAGAQPGAKVILSLARSWDIAEQFKIGTSARASPCTDDTDGDGGASTTTTVHSATLHRPPAGPSSAAPHGKVHTADVKRTVTIVREPGGGIGMRIVAAGVLPRGARVAAVTTASPADKGGLRADDVLMDVNGQSVINLALKQVENALRAAGDRITLGVVAREHFESGACQLVSIPRADERMLFDEYEEALWESEMEELAQAAVSSTAPPPSGGPSPPGGSSVSGGDGGGGGDGNGSGRSAGSGGTIKTGIKAAWGAFRKSIKEAKEQYSLRTASNKALYPSIEQSIDPDSTSLASPVNYATRPSPAVSPTPDSENSLKTLVRTASGAGYELVRGTARTLKDAAMTEFKEKVLGDTYKEGDVILEGSWEPARLALNNEDVAADRHLLGNTHDDAPEAQVVEIDSAAPFIQMDAIDGKS